jgi:actin-like protein 6A
MRFRKVLFVYIALLKSDIAGNYVTSELLKVIEAKNVPITPHYRFNKNKVEDQFFTDYLMDTGKDDPTYENYWRREIVRDAKESALAVGEDAGKREPMSNIYELPDGKTVDLADEKYAILDKLFQPSKESTGFNGYQQMIVDSINRSDLDIRKELYSNILLCGGNTLFTGFPERLQKQLFTSSSQNVKIKVITLPTLSERKFSSWIGGSILSSLGTFHQLWLSKQEYEEHGAMIIERKCA